MDWRKIEQGFSSFFWAIFDDFSKFHSSAYGALQFEKSSNMAKNEETCHQPISPWYYCRYPRPGFWVPIPPLNQTRFSFFLFSQLCRWLLSRVFLRNSISTDGFVQWSEKVDTNETFGGKYSLLYLVRYISCVETGVGSVEHWANSSAS